MKRVIKNKAFIVIILIFEILFLAYSPSMAATIPTATTTIYDYWPTADSTDSNYSASRGDLYDVSSLEQKDTFTINQYVSIGIISETEAEYFESNGTGIIYTLINSGLYYSEDTRKIFSCSSMARKPKHNRFRYTSSYI